MLSLLLAACFALPQDGMIGPDGTAVSVPETPAVVLEYLTQAQARLYDPRQHGLRSLSFSAPLHVPVLGPPVEVGVAKVTWKAGEEASIDAEPLPLPAELRAAVSAEQLPQVESDIKLGIMVLGEETLAVVLGEVFGPLFETHSGSLGTSDGKVAVTFTPAPGLEAVAGKVIWTFDEDGAPLESTTTVEQLTQQGPITLTIKTRHTWAPGPHGKLVLEKLESTRSFGPFNVTQTTTTERTSIGDMSLITAILNTQTMAGQETSKRIDLRDLVVNGEAVAVAQAAAPSQPADAGR